MTLECSVCGTRLDPDRADPESGGVLCRRCGGVTPLEVPALPPGKSEGASSLPVPVPSPGLPGKPVSPRRIPPPPGFQLEQVGKGLSLRRPWFQWGILPLALFAALWNGFMLTWYTISFVEGLWPMALFGVFHLGVGLYLAYSCLVTFFNVTELEAEDGRIRVTHSPFPTWSLENLDLGEISQLYVKRGEGRDDSQEGGLELWAILESRAHRKLLENIDRTQEALYLEQELEEFLGIQDRRVPGEISRGILGGGRRVPLLATSSGPRRFLPRTRTAASGGGEPTPGPAPEGSVALVRVDLDGEAPCPLCGVLLEGEAWVCPSCSTPHHPDCWSYGGGCSTYGCPEAPGGGS